MVNQVGWFDQLHGFLGSTSAANDFLMVVMHTFNIMVVNKKKYHNIFRVRYIAKMIMLPSPNFE